MLIQCGKCGKVYDYDKYSGICPKCARYNRLDSREDMEQNMTDMIPGAIRISMTGIRNPKILTSTVRSPMHMRKRNVKLGGSQLTDPITAKSESIWE